VSSSNRAHHAVVLLSALLISALQASVARARTTPAATESSISASNSGSVAVPKPATLLLLGIAVFSGLGIAGRRAPQAKSK
jgi:hypothetical protein